MTRILNGCLVVVISGAVILVVGAIVLYFTLPPFCGNEVKKEVFSPDGDWKVVVFVRGCGASTQNSTQVSLLPAERSLRNKKGNLCVLGFSQVKQVRWLSEDTLYLSVDPRATFYHRVESYRGITIQYEGGRPMSN